MRVESQTFWTPKRSARRVDYDDAFWPRCNLRPSTHECPSLRFAMADGATEASFSGLWARQLVHAFGDEKLKHQPGREEALTGLDPLQRRWMELIGARQLPWYAQEKSEDGAYAAFLGLVLHEGPARLEAGISSQSGAEGGSWSAAAIGDTCLFHIQMNAVRACFPLDSSSSFNSHPFLLSTRISARRNELNHVRTRQDNWNVEDHFFIMTDALARWFLNECEKGGEPWTAIGKERLSDQGQFHQWIDDLRRVRAIADDDVTLTRVHILSACGR